MKKTLLAASFASIMLWGTAHADVVKRTMPACVSEDLLDEFSKYAARSDRDGMVALIMADKCTILQAGENVSVISYGFMTATVRYNGVKLFTPSEAVR